MDARQTPEYSEQPTLGIEIEIPWQTMLSRVDGGRAAALLRNGGGFYELSGHDKAYVQGVMNEVDDQYSHKVTEAIQAGIPKSDNDGYVEFALAPRHDPDDIIADVEKLYALDLMRQHEHYPLHLTIGGLAVNGSAYYLLSSTEIYGNIRPERFVQQRTWSQKGRGGIKWRSPHELQLGTRRGVEFRTLEHTSIAQLADMLFVAQTGARAITAGHPLWQSWREQLSRHLQDADLPIGTIWSNIDHSLWQRYATVMSDDVWRQKARHIIGRHVAQLDQLDNE